ncbi:hypothetical protein EKO27_g3751 [Xylaria grammica]|uniref:PH domain-containing protein n=1 Tax=Xylaria grammica TaxID=363999 RepID=A0A439DAB7_9PEZI|nr:hypothetical protein EKO27_g3751 [Xylaria grammica]
MAKVATRDLAARDLGPRVLDGCCVEAERADRVGYCLQGLRNALPENLHPHLTAVIDHLQDTSQLLRDLADKSQIHLSQVPVMIDYLNVILPCLCRTLRDIMGFYEDKFLSKEHRWRTMYHSMSNELPGLLNYMLTRDPNFDVNAMEALRIRILQLRDARKIDPPSPIRTDLVRRDTALDFWKQETVGPVLTGSKKKLVNCEQDSHWAEAIFTQPLPSRREFRKRGKSDAFGPLDRMGHLNPFPDNVKILVKRLVTNGHIPSTGTNSDYEEKSACSKLVVQDFHTKGRRLHVMIREGSLSHCPVWTAFVPPDVPEDWLIHKGPHRIWLRDLQVYSFSDNYRPYRQRRGKTGAFQIKFAHAAAATRFKQLFNPIPDPSVEDASEEHDDGEDSSPSSDD